MRQIRRHPCRWASCGEAVEATAVATGAVAAATEGLYAAAVADEAAAADREAGMMAEPDTE